MYPKWKIEFSLYFYAGSIYGEVDVLYIPAIELTLYVKPKKDGV